jgi:hypothetical protein
MSGLVADRNTINATRLGLTHLAAALADRAEAAQQGYLEFLDLVLEEELGMREGRRHRLLTGSFDPVSRPGSGTLTREPREDRNRRCRWDGGSPLQATGVRPLGRPVDESGPGPAIAASESYPVHTE